MGQLLQRVRPESAGNFHTAVTIGKMPCVKIFALRFEASAARFSASKGML